MRVAVNVEQLLYRAPGGIGRYTARLVTLLPVVAPDVTVVPFTARHSREETARAYRAFGLAGAAAGCRIRRRAGRARPGPPAPAPARPVRPVAHRRRAGPGLAVRAAGRLRPDPRPVAGGPPEGAGQAGRLGARRGPVALPRVVHAPGPLVPSGWDPGRRPPGRPGHHRKRRRGRRDRAPHHDRRRPDPGGAERCGRRRRHAGRRGPHGRPAGPGRRPVRPVGGQPRTPQERGCPGQRVRPGRRRRRPAPPAGARRSRRLARRRPGADRRSGRPRRAATPARAGRRGAHGGALRGRRSLRLPQPARGVRAPGARGHGPGHGRAVRRHPGPRRGGRGAGRLVAPDDIDGWAVALRELLVDAPARQPMAAAGRLRAASLPWEDTIRATYRVYEEALSGRRRPATPGERAGRVQPVRAFVTGGSGFVGPWLVEHLRDAGRRGRRRRRGRRHRRRSAWAGP